MSIDNFYAEIQKIDLTKDNAHEEMQRVIREYDEKFQQQHFQPTPQQLGSQFKSQITHIELPPQGSDLEKNLKSQFIADGSVFGSYQKMLRQAQVPEYHAPKPPESPKPEVIAQMAFTRPYNNYQDTNVNTRYLERPLFDNSQEMFFENQRQLMMCVQPTVEQKPQFVTNIKQRINELGGIEDTVQVMKQSLLDYEEKHIPQPRMTGPIQMKSTLQPQTQSLIPPKEVFHPFANYIQDTNLSVLQYSQSLRSKIQ